nr:tRNA epoxyqueuosine(34) reductase QueG [Granulosicoccus sp.]
TKLVTLFEWSESDFDERLQGSPIRRIGYECWLRNIAVALGNAETSPEVVTALANRQHNSGPLVTEHVSWALQQHNR